MKYPDIDRIYRTIPLDNIPWDNETPPTVLVDLVEDGIIRPCRAVDLGCGAGNYAIYLAGLGFEVTGIDSSPAALQFARQRAEEKGVACRFIVADVLGDLHEVRETFDFVYDWELLHHIFPEDRTTYLRNVRNILNPGACYLSVCFSEEDSQFGGTGKYRKTQIGTMLYFSSESEIRDLFSQYFAIRDIRTIDISGKFGSHRAIRVLSGRK